jgi:outer membrane receptor protein involved in Fe transport
VLERSPGVIVDRQNNTIAINGKDGVVVMINGKINHMPASAIIQWLNGMSANNIEKIELITTPPANLDAEGNAGYINVVLKQNNNYGTNGSLSGTLGYGRGWVSQAGMNINHRKGKINMYGDISYSRTKGPFVADLYSRISNAGDITETNFYGDRKDTIRNITGRFGLDWQTGAKTVAGILVSGYDNRYTQSEHNTSDILINGSLDTTIYHDNNEMNHWSNYTANLNLQHDFNENDKLLLNADYIHYYNNQPVNYNSSYYDKDGKFVYDQVFRSLKTTPMDFWVGAADYLKKINKNISLETGIKQTFSSFNNDISFERLIQDAWIKDDSLSAKYKMKEDYNAAYFSLDITVNSNTAIKAGLRYEYTNSNLGTDEIKNIVDRHYGDFFPTLFISHKLSGNSTVDFSYGRRINRPTFNDLAPFTYYINANTLITGNPSLQPSLTNNFKADYTFRQYLFSFSYSKEDNAIAAFQPHTDSVTNKVVWSAENLINQKTASALIVIPVSLTK